MRSGKDVPSSSDTVIAEDVTFTHENCPTVAVAGKYRGTVMPTLNKLGGNGAGREWGYVIITAAPKGAEKYVGTYHNVWRRKREVSSSAKTETGSQAR